MNLTLYFDGACEPRNPGGVATCGWLILGPDGEQIAEGHKCVARGVSPNAMYKLIEAPERLATDLLD